MPLSEQERRDLDELNRLERLTPEEQADFLEIEKLEQQEAQPGIDFGKPEKKKSFLGDLDIALTEFATTPAEFHKQVEIGGFKVPPEFTEQLRILESGAKELVRFPEIITTAVEEGVIPTAERFATFTPNTIIKVLNAFGAGIPTAPRIFTDPTLREFLQEPAPPTPTALEAQEQIKREPLSTALGLLPVPKIARGVGRLAKEGYLKSTIKLIDQLEKYGDAAVVGEQLKAGIDVASVERALTKPLTTEVPKLKVEAESIRSAALKLPNGKVYEGKTHPDAAGKLKGKDLDVPLENMKNGFVTTRGRFVERKEAVKIAKSSKQIKDSFKELDSYDLNFAQNAVKSTGDLGELPKNTSTLEPSLPTEVSFDVSKATDVSQSLKPEVRVEQYPILNNMKVIRDGKSIKFDGTKVKGDKIAKATDSELASFGQISTADFKALKSKEKSSIRKAFNKDRRKQLNEYNLDKTLNKELGIIPDPVLKKKFAEDQAPTFETFEEFNEPGKIKTNFADPDRILGESMPSKIADDLIRRRDQSAGEWMDFVIKEHESYKAKVEKELGIRPGSRLDRAVMDYGEGRINDLQLIKKFGNKKAENISAATKWYREQYERYIKEHNTIVSHLYPGEQTYLLRRRPDYFRHMQEISGAEKLLDMVVEDLGGQFGIPVRILDFVKPKGRKLSIMKERKGGKFIRSASTGFNDYLRQVGFGINMNPMIKYMRDFSNKLDKSAVNIAKKSKTPIEPMENLRSWMNQWVNGMEGIIHPIDAALQNIFPGKSYEMLAAINRRAKRNVIVGNISTVLAQPFNIPQAISEMGSKYYAEGVARTLGQIIMNERVLRSGSTNPMALSSFMKERYIGSMFNQYKIGWAFRHGLDNRLSLLTKSQNAAGWALLAADEISTKTIWNGFHTKAIKENLGNPIEYANRQTRKMVAGRGVGELANIQRAQIFQMIAPFQIEVGNAAWAVRDIVKGERRLSKLATFTLASWLMNTVSEETRGSRVSFDPLDAMIEGVKIAMDDQMGTFERAIAIPGRLAGEVFSNLPVGQSIARILPKEFREVAFGQNDPTRYGSSLLIFDSVDEWPYRLAPTFGGIQLKKTIGGIKAIQQEGVVRSRSGKTALFKIGDTPEAQIQALLFGPYAAKSGLFKQRDEEKRRRKIIRRGRQ